jgi:hypothetical protein
VQTGMPRTELAPDASCADLIRASIAFVKSFCEAGMDCRVKPGNDGVIDRSTIHSSCPALCRASTSYFPQARKTWMAPQLGLARVAHY